MKRLLKNKKGTAEVIGSVMFIVILLFFFTNVYLWHDAATKDMNELYVKKMNAGMEPKFDPMGTMGITAKGSDVVLSRIWVVTNDNRHLYADLEEDNIHLIAGKFAEIIFMSGDLKPDDTIQYYWNEDNYKITLYIPSSFEITDLSVLNTLGVIV